MTLCYHCNKYNAQTSICTVTGRIEDVVTCESFVETPDESTIIAEEAPGKVEAVDLSHLKDDPNDIKILLSNYDPKKTTVFDCRAYFERHDVVTFEVDLKEVLREIYEGLVRMNKEGGDVSLNPVQVFSKSDSVEQLRVRIDDKLSRFIKGGVSPAGEDERALLGDLVLLQIARWREAKKEV